MSAATMVNDRFLRSGAEFGPANNATSNARRYNSHLLRGRDARAKDFATRMLGNDQLRAYNNDQLRLPCWPKFGRVPSIPACSRRAWIVAGNSPL